MSYRLTPSERKIISIVQYNSRMTISQIAAKAKMRHHTVNYCMKNLLEKKIINPCIIINPHAVGLTDYCLFFNCQSESENTRKKVIEFIKNSEKVAYCAEIAGHYCYTVSLYCRTAFEVTEFFSQLSKVIPKSSFDKTFALRVRFVQISGKIFGGSCPVTYLDRTKPDNEYILDECDRKILSIYSKNAGLSLRKISSMVGISESVLRYRLKMLEERKIILAYGYLLDDSKIGTSTFRVVISARNLSESFYDSVLDFAFKHPDAYYFIHCVGSWDFELSFLLENQSALGDILGELEDKFGNNIRSMQVFTEIKVHKARYFPLKSGIP